MQDDDDGSPPILEVTALVDFLWNEAIGCLTETLSVPVETLKLPKVQEAEAIWGYEKNPEWQLWWRRNQKALAEFCQLIPHECETLSLRKVWLQRNRVCARFVRFFSRNLKCFKLNLFICTSILSCSSSEILYLSASPLACLLWAVS